MKICLYLFAILPCFIFSSCTTSVNDTPEELNTGKTTTVADFESQLNSDSTLIKLKEFNDATINNPQNIETTRGWREFWGFLKFVAVVVADVKGAIQGAQWGSSCLGVTGAIVGAVVVGAACSAATGLSYTTNSRASFMLDQERIELAYVNAKLNEDLITDEYLLNPQIQINIPSEYASAFNNGILHNITLKIIDENIPMEYSLEDGLSVSEIDMLHSDFFTSKYNFAMDNPHIYSIEYISENLTKEDLIVQLFIQLYQEYPNDFDDVNYIINQYIEIIESDERITELQKECVYSALSTAAFSTSYWYKKSLSEYETLDD